MNQLKPFPIIIRLSLFIGCLIIVNVITAQVSQFPQVYFNAQGAQGSNLAIKSQASSTSGQVYTRYAPGSKLGAVQVVFNNSDPVLNTWVKVCIPGTTGSIRYGYIAYGEYYARIDEFNFYGTVTTQTLNIRSGAGTNYARITIGGSFATLGQGSVVALTGLIQTVNGTPWYEIYLTNECSQSTGWVSSGATGQYLSTNFLSPYKIVGGKVRNASNGNVNGANVNVGTASTLSSSGFYQYKVPENVWTTITCSASGYSSSTPTSHSYYSGSHDYSKDFVMNNVIACTTPPNASQAPHGANQFRLSWGAVAGANNYTVQFKQSSSSVWNTYSTGNLFYDVNVSPGLSYTWQVRANCSSGSSNYTNTQSFAPPCPPLSVTNQPNNATRCVGQTVSFSVSANNATGYQWQFQVNGSGSYNNLNGQTGSILTLSNVNSSNGGNYRCQVSNNCGSITSNAASLTVNTCNPQVDFSANSTQIIAGGNIDFSSITTNNPTSFFWEFDGASPSTSTAPNPSNIQFNTARCYEIKLTVSNSSGSATEIKTCYIKVLPNLNVAPPEDFAQQLDWPSGKAGDPVNAATGAFLYAYQDFFISTRNSALDWKRMYNSRNANSLGDLGYGWSHSYNIHLTVNPGVMWTVHHPDGHKSYHIPYENGTSLPLYARTRERMVENSDGSFTLTFKHGTKWEFNSSGNLTAIVDRNGNSYLLTYNAAGKLSTVTGPGGRSLNFSYHASGLLQSVQGPLGRIASFNYNVASELANSINTNGKSMSYTYDNAHQILTMIDPRGNLMLTNTYDGNQRVVQQKDALNKITTFTYDTPVNGATTVTNPIGGTKVFYHDARFRLIQETDEGGKNRYYTYNSDHDLTQVTDEKGNVTGQAFDSQGNLISKTNTLGYQSHITYNADNDPVLFKNALNQRTFLSYDLNGNLLKTLFPRGDSIQSVYDSHGQRISFTDGEGLISSFSYNSQGDMTQAILPDKSISYVHDLAGRVIRKTDGNGNQTHYAYDGFDNVIKITNALGDSVIFVYDNNGNKISEKNWKGYLTQYRYDMKDRLIEIEGPTGNVITFVYDDLDRITSFTDARGNTVSFIYDVKGRLVSFTDGLGTTSYTYDELGNQTSQTDALGRKTEFRYDAWNQLDSIINPLGNVLSFIQDSLGRLIVSINGLNQSTFYDYDEGGNLIKVEDAAGEKTYYYYNHNHQIDSVRNPKGHIQRYFYNSAGRLSSKIDAQGNIATFSYDSNGNLTGETLPKGVNPTTVSYGYDVLNRLKSAVYSTGENYSYDYDKNSNLESMTFNIGMVSLVYDSLDRIMSVNDAFGKQVEYTYDANGNTTQIRYPDGKTVGYTYNSVNQMSSVLDWAGNLTTYTYDGAGQLIQALLGNGTRVEQVFDQAGQLTQIANKYGNGNVIFKSQYTLDALGRAVQEQRTEPLSVAFGPISEGYSYGSSDVLQSSTSSTYVNDKSGNRLVENSFQKSRYFEFSGHNLLKQNILLAGTDTLVSNYEYDPVFNRVSKTSNGEQRRNVLDMTGKLTQVLQETDTSGNTLVSNVYGLGLISRTDSSGLTHFFHFDAQGNTVALTSSSGNLTDSYAYGPFGQELAYLGSTDQPYRFLGKYGIEAEGDQLYFVRRRFYDARNGRFIGSDPYPADFRNPQSLNRFIYGLNDPLHFIDPTGLKPEGVNERIYVSDDLKDFGSLSRDLALDGVIKVTKEYTIKPNGGLWKKNFYGNQWPSSSKEVVKKQKIFTNAIKKGAQLLNVLFLYKDLRDINKQVKSNEISPGVGETLKIFKAISAAIGPLGLLVEPDVAGGDLSDITLQDIEAARRYYGDEYADQLLEEFFPEILK